MHTFGEWAYMNCLCFKRRGQTFVHKVRITTLGQSLIMHIFVICTIYDLCVSDMLSYILTPIRTNFYEILIMGLETIGKNRKNGCMKTIGQSP